MQAEQAEVPAKAEGDVEATAIGDTVAEGDVQILVQHHCSHRGCPRSKSTCNNHYWTCTGRDVSHPGIRVFEGKACERNVRRNGKVERCGNSK